MPFIGSDWRSPGDKWIRTEFGWKRLADIRNNLNIQLVQQLRYLSGSSGSSTASSKSSTTASSRTSSRQISRKGSPVGDAQAQRPHSSGAKRMKVRSKHNSDPKATRYIKFKLYTERDIPYFACLRKLSAFVRFNIFYAFLVLTRALTDLSFTEGQRREKPKRRPGKESRDSDSCS